MAEITAAAVKSLRDDTGLPMMDCKQALQATSGDQEAAKRWLREKGLKVMGNRQDRETSCGRIGVYVDFAGGKAAMVEVLCESAPVANNEEFVALANDLAKQLATGPGAATADELLAQKSPGKAGQTLADQKNDLSNKIREVFNIPRLARVDGPCGGYAHHDGSSAVLVEVEGGNEGVAREVAMHVAAMNPQVAHKEELDAAEVEKERSILREVALKEGKPANIVDKMVEGRLRTFFGERVLTEQPFVKDDSKTVGKYSQDAKMKIKRYVHWKRGK